MPNSRIKSHTQQAESAIDYRWLFSVDVNDVEFDDDEDTVVIEDEETGDEIVGYQDEMFIPEE